MMNTNWRELPMQAEALAAIQPRMAIDLDVNGGGWAMLARQVCDLWAGRLHRGEWELRLEGVVGASPDLPEWLEGVYQSIHVGDPIRFLRSREANCHMVNVGSLPAAMEKDEALDLIDLAARCADYVSVAVPMDSVESSDNGDAQRPKSVWPVGELDRLAVVVSEEWTTADGGKINWALLSEGDPKNVREILNPQSSPGDYSLPDPISEEEARRVIEKAQRMRAALDCCRADPAYQTAQRLRANPLWRGLKRISGKLPEYAEIRVLGEKNEDSQGYEARLLGVRAGLHSVPMPWDQLKFLTNDWEWVKDPSAPDENVPQSSSGTLQAPILSEDASLVFLNHPWSGKIEVAFRGRREVFDLYSEEDGQFMVVWPAHAPMAGRPPEEIETPSLEPAPKLPRVEDFTRNEREWLKKNRGAEIVAVHTPRWLGVSSSTRALFANTLPFPQSPDREPYNVSAAELERTRRLIEESGARHVVMSGGDRIQLDLAGSLRERDPDIRVDLLWHGSYMHFAFDYDWRVFRDWLTAAREGIVHCVGVTKQGMETLLEQRGVRSRFVMNYVADVPDGPSTPEEDGPHLGLWFSGVNFSKQPFPMIAASAMVPDAKLRGAGLTPRMRDAARLLGVSVREADTKPLPHARLMDEMRETHLSLYVTFSECSPMLPLESLSVGTPCLVGPTSHLFEDHEYLFERLVVPSPDRADVIARYIEKALAERDEIIRAYIEYAPKYNKAARESVERFLAE